MGGRTLREEGVLRSLDGMSSLEEVLRVTHSEDSEPMTFEPATHRPTPTLHSTPTVPRTPAPSAGPAPAKPAPVKEVA
jgi:hypothetical protein